MDGASVPSKATQYQLDVVDLAGGVTPLWASAPVPGGIFPPTNFFLSSGSLSEVVLGVSNAGGAEFTIFNEVGMPVASFSAPDTTWKAPVLVNNAGATVAMLTGTHTFCRHLAPPPLGQQLFEASLIPASLWRPGVCGAPWLRGIAARALTTSDPLAATASMCGL